MLANVKRVNLLQEYTVEKKASGWFYSRTSRFGTKHEAKGPYSSMVSVTLMIARELKRELIKRDAPYNMEE